MIHSCPRATYTQKTQRYIKDNKYYKYRDSKALIIEVDIGTFPPNAFSLYDMHGNVWEWCEDNRHNNYINAPTDGVAWNSRSGSYTKLLRGGSWAHYARHCRSAYRNGNLRDYRSCRYGFRVAFYSRTL